MTGFGRGVAERGALRATVDVRAVNHRFFDLKIRGAHVAPAVEDAIAHTLRAAGVERGAVTVTITLQVARAAAPSHVESPGSAGARSTAEGRCGESIDRDAARAAHATLAALASELHLAPPDLALVLAQPGVVRTDGPAAAPDDDATAEAITAATRAALAELAAMRASEGAALAADLAAQVAALAAARERLAALAAQLPAQLQRRLADRIAKLAPDVALDPQRLAHEVALLADRADVSEELVRLASHLDQARALLATREAIGRRLDFLTQEIGRELNTIGSKSASAEITTVVVDAKATLEKLREQVQNVE